MRKKILQIIQGGNMYWEIIIITKNYESIAKCFLNYSTYLNCCYSKHEMHIHSDFIIIHIYPYPNSLRGHKADLVYIDDDIYEDEEIRASYFMPIAVNGTVLPLSKLLWRLKNYEEV